MTKIDDDGGAAFPTHGGHPGDDWRNRIIGGGMTLRDWFAGQALAGVISACSRDSMRMGQSLEGHFAKNAYSVADAMIATRMKGPSDE